MKIKLTAEKGVQILELSETIGIQDAKVLRAGIGKLLKAGKNKIVVEMPANQDLPAEVIRELAVFDLLARELSGRVVLGRVSPPLKAKLVAFSKPPMIVCYDSRQQAVTELAEPPKPDALALVPSPAAVPAHHADQDSLKMRLADLEKENQALREQLVASIIARRPPADEAAIGDRIQFLENKIEKLLAEAPPPGGGAAAAKKTG